MSVFMRLLLEGAHTLQSVCECFCVHVCTSMYQQKINNTATLPTLYQHPHPQPIPAFSVDIRIIIKHTRTMNVQVTREPNRSHDLEHYKTPLHNP